MRRAETRGRDSGGVTAKDEHTAESFFTATFEMTPQQQLENLPAQCDSCGAVIGPVEAKIWSEAAQAAHIALFICPHDGHRFTRTFTSVELWLAKKPTTVQVFTPPTPVTKTIDEKPVFSKTIDLSSTDQLPPVVTRVHYRYALGKTGNFATGKRKGYVVIHARWTDDTGQRYRWKREFESRDAAMAFGRRWAGIDETRELNRGLIMSWIP
jgi:hypothetical protein